MAGFLPNVPFTRGSSRSARQPTSSGGRADSITDDLRKGSWVLAQDAPTLEKDDLSADLEELNGCLWLLSDVFPDVQHEVFREMLLNVSKESRIEIVTEHLLKDKGKWVRGRYRTAATEQVSTTGISEGSRAGRFIARTRETFRSEAYRNAVKEAFYLEFKGLSHATIKAVLAEHNSSYAKSRPVLHQLSTKSWRYYLSNIWTTKKSDALSAYNHPLINWQSPYGPDGPQIPYLRRTESHELNQELYSIFIAPIMLESSVQRLRKDSLLAQQLNEEEATGNDALFECQCCYTSAAFEGMASCSSGDHMVCFQCIRFTVNEALFGQGWARTVNADKMALQCLASSADGCDSIIKSDLIRRALLSAPNDGLTLFRKLEDRVAKENLDKCNVPLLRCPFCTYAETDELPSFRMDESHRISKRVANLVGGSQRTWLYPLFELQIFTALILITPLIHLVLLLSTSFWYDALRNAQRRVLRRRRGLRFRCLAPSCSAASCVTCLARWTDPHICYETATKSLRHAVEAATTAVVKRTCPRCNMSFVKSSGCNKLVCPCGYNMCYICRAPIANEGYAHFCQHFRASGGRCTECDRCDLYKVEDEEATVKRAAEQAGKAWREKEGKSSLSKLDDRSRDRLGLVAEEVIRGPGHAPWALDDALDGLLDMVLA
ncbi:hypothetical protein CAC42_5224 [Sphaceloma murrayae]|uniref:RING-type domain-containing protein n=1 Tax=Sphaceloma murrayae TaxID=2082308 RepID=A0A2K1QUF3_9PEZI|nr:hypothetical protein CAC42_5224 [Sphaceloma murrayae]